MTETSIPLTATQQPRSLLRRITRNFGWSMLSEVGGKGLLFLVTVYLARVLGVAHFGLFSFAQTVTSYCWLGVDLGINMYGAREIAKNKADAARIINPLLTLRIFSGLFLFILFGLAVLIIYRQEYLKQIVFAGFAFYLLTRALNLDWVMRGFEKFNFIALGNFATFLSMLLLLVFFVTQDRDILLASFIWSLCYLLGDLLLLVLFYTNLGLSFRPEWDYQTLKLHVKESIHFTIANSLLFLYQYLPIIFLGLLASDYEVGVFSAPYRLVLSIAYAVSLLPLALYPTLSELYHHNRAQFNRVYKYFLFVSLATGVFFGLGGMLLAKPLILLLYGEGYAESIPIFQIINWFGALTAVRVAYGIAIAASGLQRFYTWASIFGVLFFTGAFFSMSLGLQIPQLYAASYAFVLTEVGVSAILFIIWKIKNQPITA